MAGFRISTPDGILTLQARQLGDGSWVQELAAEPARKTPVGPPEKLSVGTGAVVGLTPPSGATHALVFVVTNTVHFYDDGSTPTTGTTGNGAPLAAGNALELDMATFANFKMIAETGTATVHVLYYRYGA